MHARQRQAQWAKSINRAQMEVFSDHGKATKSHSCKSKESKVEREKKQRNSKTEKGSTQKTVLQIKLHIGKEHLLVIAIASDSKTTKAAPLRFGSMSEQEQEELCEHHCAVVQQVWSERATRHQSPTKATWKVHQAMDSQWLLAIR
jgi:hypothetical protein